VRRKVLAEGSSTGRPILHRRVSEMRGYGQFSVDLRFALGEQRTCVPLVQAIFVEALVAAQEQARLTGACDFYLTGEYRHAVA